MPGLTGTVIVPPLAEMDPAGVPLNENVPVPPTMTFLTVTEPAWTLVYVQVTEPPGVRVMLAVLPFLTPAGAVGALAVEAGQVPAVGGTLGDAVAAGLDVGEALGVGQRAVGVVIQVERAQACARGREPEVRAVRSAARP